MFPFILCSSSFFWCLPHLVSPQRPSVRWSSFLLPCNEKRPAFYPSLSAFHYFSPYLHSQTSWRKVVSTFPTLIHCTTMAVVPLLSEATLANSVSHSHTDNSINVSIFLIPTTFDIGYCFLLLPPWNTHFLCYSVYLLLQEAIAYSPLRGLPWWLRW